MDKNNELINQILTDLQKDENIDTSNININQLAQPHVENPSLPPPSAQIYNLPPTPLLPAPTLASPPQQNDNSTITQVQPQVIEQQSFTSKNKTSILFVKDFFIFIIIFFLVSLPQLNSVVVDMLPENMSNIYIILLIKGVIGSILFVISNKLLINKLDEL